MNDDLTRHLDGEVGADGLDPRQRAEAEAWNRMVASFRRSVPSNQAPPWLEERVMAEIEAIPPAGLVRAAVAWMLAPRPVRVPPLVAGLVAAAFAAVILWSPGAPNGSTPPVPASTATVAGGASFVYVQFALEAPGATSVAVAGDFSEWEPSFLLDDPDGDGVWSGRVPVRPGVHAYMFLVDGTEWHTDPRADRYRDDGFGNRNALLAVGGSGD